MSAGAAERVRPAAEAEAGLALEDVQVALGGRRVLGGVTLSIRPGEVVGLAGPNGAGKTTLLRVASRVLRPSAGEVRVGGRPIESLSRRALARELGVVPQSPDVAFPFRVGEVVLMGRTPHLSAWSFETPDDVTRARAAMTQLGLEPLADRSILELSGGERQLVWIARALAQDPTLLLLDEPTAHLDLPHRLQVLERVREFARAGGGALLVSHDLQLAASHCDRLALLHRGRLHAVGPPSEVLTPDVLREVYGVEAEILSASDGTPLVVPRQAAASGASLARQREEQPT